MIWDLGGVVWVAISIVEFKKRVTRKLRRIILLHFELVSFRFHLGKTRVVIICMFFGLGGHVHGPQNQLCLTLDTPSFSKCFKNKRILLEIHDFWRFQNIGIRKLNNLWTNIYQQT